MDTAQKPLLIAEDLAPLQALQRAQSKVFQHIEVVKDAYTTLNIGEFNQQVYNTIVVGRVEEIRQQYILEARQGVERLGISNSQIRQNLLAGTRESFNPFAEAVNQLVAITYNPSTWSSESFPFHLISIDEEQRPILTEQATAEYIESRCKTFISTENEFRVYETFKELQEACNSFNSILRSAGLSVGRMDFQELNSFFVKDDNGIVGFKADQVKWLANRIK
jgi:hypothetical protein